MPTLEHNGTYYILKDAPKGDSLRSYGFRLSDDLKIWYTPDPKVAVRYRASATAKAADLLDRVFLHHGAWHGNIFEFVPKDKELQAHQFAAVEYGITRNRAYLGLDAGLGKTICAAIYAKIYNHQRGGPVYYLCPPFLVQNVEAEFKKWAPELETAIYGQSFVLDFIDVDVLIIPDSLLINEDVTNHIKKIVNDNIFQPALIVDEAHRYKSESAQRTKVLFGYAPKASSPRAGLVDLFPRQLYMSGSPMPQRPLELYPILSKVAPETIDFMNFFDYGRKYCAGYKTHFGWDFSGSSNMKELQSRVIAPRGKFMLRMHKDMIELPPKIEEVFVMGHNMSPRLTKMDGDLTAELYSKGGDIIKSILAHKAGIDEDDFHVASYRKALGLEKVKQASEYIKILLEETEDNLIVFAHHHEVVLEFEKSLKEWMPIIITGKVPVDARYALVDKYQNNPKHRLIIGNEAMGVGYNITKANRILFPEFSWNGSTNSQFIDRAHRIGQKNTVLAQYMVFKDSLDQLVIEALLEKQKATQYI